MQKQYSMPPPIICLMGPTASGKTQLAFELSDHLACDIISVDSAMVYRGMDIGTAKPSPSELALCPHRLIDIADPAHIYSAGQFCVDALQEIENTLAAGRIPLLVGGTMLYFRALQQGLSPLPKADPHVRQQLAAEAAALGWPALHYRLSKIDPVAAHRIQINDGQRIQRALEVYELTGMSLTDFCRHTITTTAQSPFPVLNIALIPGDRELLHQRIASRFAAMLRQGLITEVEALYQRNDLNSDLPALRAVGYRQVWHYLAGKLNAEEMKEESIIATRQLAKRQLTWLRSWPNISIFDSQDPKVADKVIKFILSYGDGKLLIT
jgi:tRNA dimethylallyltransferase